MANVGDDVIVLDVLRDMYSCLAEASRWLTVLDDHALSVVGEAHADALIEAGLAQRNPLHQLRKPLTRPRFEAAETSGFRAIDLLSIWLSLIGTASMVRSLALAEALEIDAGVALDHRDSNRLGSLVGAWRAVLPYAPLEGECLQRAFQLRRILARRGLATNWVFGVATFPFAAHCWLQSGDRVIGDTLSRVTRYTPILVA